MSETTPMRRGVPIVISSPSGGGKTTLCHRLIARLEGVAASVSYTTRPRRAHERDGVHYHFVTAAQFDALVAEDALLEWAYVHGHRYGTGRSVTEQRLAAGQDVLFDIDVQGGRQLAARLNGLVLVFVLPPSMATLEARLRGRGSDSEPQVAKRLQAARKEIEAARGLYTYWIVNDELERATHDLVAIVEAARLGSINVEALLARVLGDASGFE